MLNILMDVNTKEAGIYKLTCSHNGKIYIGKAVNIHKRIIAHKHCEKKGSGSNHLQNSIRKYGWDSFTVEVLEIFENFDKLIDNNSLLLKESNYIKLFNSSDPNVGYNICTFSTDRTGIPCSSEHREKIRQSKLGKPHTEETKNKMRIPKSKEHKEKCRIAAKGHIHSKESRDKMSRANLGKKRKPFSKETRDKMSLSKLGKKRSPFSEEHKERIRQGSVGKIMSEESKEKMRKAKIGKPRSEETKEKLRKYQDQLRLNKLNSNHSLEFEN